MPFLTQGKTNWKYILIVVILAIIVGGLVLYYYPKFPKVKPPPKPEKKVTITTDKTKYEEGEIVTAIIKNNLDKPIWYIEYCGEEPLDVFRFEEGNWKQIHQRILMRCASSYWAVKIKARETKEIKYNGTLFFEDLFRPGYKYKIGLEYSFEEPKTKELKESIKIYSNEFTIKEKIKTEMPEEVVNKYPNIKMVVQGKLDKFSEKEILVAFYETLLFDKWVIFSKENESYVVIKEGNFGNEATEERVIEHKKFVGNEPEFFVTKAMPIVGACVSAGNSINIYRIENNEFKRIYSIDISYYDVFYDEKGNPIGQVEITETQVEFKDLDNDGNLEIIREGTKKLCKGKCYTCEELIREEKVYQIFKWDSKNETFVEEGTKLLSYIDVYFSKGIQGKISLYLTGVRTRTIEVPYCGAPKVGSKEYTGKAKLSFKDSELDLGEMTFTEDSLHDGTLWTKKLNLSDDRDFIIILQYGSCNAERARFYGYDFREANLIQYKFEKKDGKIQNEVIVAPTKDFLEILPSRDFISKYYDNSIGKYRSTKWRFNSEKDIFEEVDDWLEPL